MMQKDFQHLLNALGTSLIIHYLYSLCILYFFNCSTVEYYKLFIIHYSKLTSQALK